MVLRSRADANCRLHFVHRVRFVEDVFGEDHQVLADVLEASEGQPARVQFWVDANLMECWPELRAQIREFGQRHAGRMVRAGSVQIVPGGEQVKNDIHLLERILKVFHATNLDRRSYVVVIGGGAVLDTVGFAASIAHRGLRLVRLPTTTLAQADSAIGVKNGVNLFFKKNWLGTFSVPWAVINDAKLLTTLDPRDYVCGFSEAVKVSLLKDPAFFDRLCRNAVRIRQRDLGEALPVIRQSATWHLDHIVHGGDPFEMLQARPLDFGHWSAHKLETMSDFELRHGEAVAIGVAVDSVYSSLVHGFPVKDAVRVLQCLSDLGFSLHEPTLRDRDLLFEGLEEFRQHLGGRLTVTMLTAVGRPVDVHVIDRRAMAEATERVLEYGNQVERRSWEVGESREPGASRQGPEAAGGPVERPSGR